MALLPGYAYFTTRSHILVNTDFTWQSQLYIMHYTCETVLRVTDEEMQHLVCQIG